MSLLKNSGTPSMGYVKNPMRRYRRFDNASPIKLPIAGSAGNQLRREG